MIKIENLSLWDTYSKQFEIQDIELESEEQVLIDATNLVGLPVGIDLHVHFRQPGYETKEDISSGSLAALHGGVVSVLDMPNTNPVTDSVKQVQFKKELAEKHSKIDYLVASAITNSNINELREINQYCDAYKVFMAESFGKLAVSYENIGAALAILEEIETTKPIIFHAEDPVILEQNKNQPIHRKQRPAEAEACAIQQIVNWANEYPKLKFHVTHLSSSLGLRVFRVTKAENVSSDTCPRYLLLDENSAIPDWKKKVNPPIRSALDKKELRDAFAIGEIDMISSDHSPHTVKEKKMSNPSGMPGVQELLPTLFTLVKSGEIGWERAVEAYHDKPKELLNIEKLDIEQGNLLLLDLREPIKITKEWVKSKVKWSPFENMLLYGKIQYVIKDNKILLKSKKQT
ncbi:MAG: dihydroorotase [Candidatus Heimdallarchaeaceae archaeon]